MSENEFWLKLWKCVAVLVCVLAALMSGCVANRHYQIRTLIENTKVDPILAKCAIEGELGGDPLCVARAVR